MYEYLPIEEQLYSPDVGNYLSYGICVKDEVGNTLAVLSDISTDKQLVIDLALRCANGQLAPEHLMDVVLNSI